MELKIKKLNDAAISPIVENGMIVFYASDISTEISRDGRLILVYKSGIEIEIPEGKIGILMQIDDAALNSLEFAGGHQVLKYGTPIELLAKFKTNTDAVPAIPEPGTAFAKMLLLDTQEIELSIEEYVKPIEEVREESQAPKELIAE